MKTTPRLSLLAAALLMAFQAHAFDPFEVKDIKVEGIQRTEAGTVFSYLPVKVGDTLTADKAAAAIQALYATGFFKDVRLETQNGVLLIQVEERPAISQVDFTGMKEFSAEDIKASLKQLGLSEGRILDKSVLDKAEQELKRQYYNRGLYAVQVKARLSPLERNRTAITFEINEGEVAKIRAINIIGNQSFKEKELLKLLTLRTPGMMTWFTKNDQYSKQKLAADLEILRSHYMNQGYLEFRVESTQVSITPDKKDVYITVNLREGDKYTIADYKLAGDLPLPEAELKKLVDMKPGDVFSREVLNQSVKKLSDRLGNEGYAFANINASPEIDKEKRQVSFTYYVDPGRKVHVRRINVAGNTKTKDEVIRREMRQMEGATYATDKITRSRERVQRLSYFKDVNIETPVVPDTPDQVDLNLSVTEQSTGNIMIGAGFSSSDGIVLSGGISQNNLFGTGNRLSLQLNSGSINTVYALSYTQPYFTQDGVSVGYDLYRRDVDTSDSSAVVAYTTSTVGEGVRLAIPISEYDTVNLGAAFEGYNLELGAQSPSHMVAFVQRYNGYRRCYDPRRACDDTDTGNIASAEVSTLSLRLDAGWARDSRDSFLFPTKGTYQKAHMEFGTPVGDLQYYKLSYEYQWLRPLSANTTLMLNGEIGYGGGFSGDTLPFFRNFYAGGIGSVRGFDNGALGPKSLDRDGDTIAVGGDKRLVGNAELLFPFPGAGNDKSLRLSAFMDAGAVWGPDDHLGRFKSPSFSDLRFSAGMAVTWYSPMGPIKLSLAKPLRKEADDKEQMFQFQMGQVF